MNPITCRAIGPDTLKGCKNEPIPGFESGFCDYHESMSEEGFKVFRKSDQRVETNRRNRAIKKAESDARVEARKAVQ